MIIKLECPNCGSDDTVRDKERYYSVWIICNDCRHKFKLKEADWKEI